MTEVNKYEKEFELSPVERANSVTELTNIMHSVHTKLKVNHEYLSLLQLDQVLTAITKVVTSLASLSKHPRLQNQALVNEKSMVPSIVLCNPEAPTIRLRLTPQEFQNHLVREHPKAEGWISAGSIRIFRQNNPEIDKLFTKEKGGWKCWYDELDAYFDTPASKHKYPKIYDKRKQWKEQVYEYQRKKRKGEAHS